MKKILISCIVSPLAAFAANAADLPARASAPAPAPIFTQSNVWQGFYIGAQVGVGRLNTKNSDLDDWYFDFRNAKTKDVSALFGLRAGYDATFGSMLVGALVEGSFASLDSQKEIRPTNPAYRVGAATKFLGSARAKLGFHSGDFAAFATAGLAVSDHQYRYNETDGTGETLRMSSRFGYVIGVGAAYAITKNLSIGLDISRYQFRNKTGVLLDNTGASTGSRWSMKSHVDTAMISLNYRFGGASGPVVARY